MYLKKVYIKNFRCFRYYEIDLSPEVTVLFGKNGSGKSTLVNAIHKALSFMMHSVKIKEKVSKTKRSKVLEVQDITDGNPYVRVEGFSKFGDEHYNGVKPIDYTIDIHAEAVLENQHFIEWSISAYAKNGGKRPSEYKKAFSDLYENYAMTGERPLLAFYSDVYPFQTVKRTVSKHEKGKNTYLLTSEKPGMAYTDWDDETGITNKWVERLEAKLRNRMQYMLRDIVNQKQGINTSDEEKAKNAMDVADIEQEIGAITDCLRVFSDLETNNNGLQVRELDLGKWDNRLNVYLTKGAPIPFRKLPAGYLRLYSIVLDIAYRSYILSGRKTTDVSGIVIIDEIDLHLHPELEKNVLRQLKKTFPHIQFIVTTHSPLILTNVKTTEDKNSVLQMTPRHAADSLVLGQNGPIKRDDLYGLDYSTSVQEGMDVSSGDEELDWAISECVFMLRNSLFEQTEILKKQILEKKLISSEELEKRINRILNK